MHEDATRELTALTGNAQSLAFLNHCLETREGLMPVFEKLDPMAFPALVPLMFTIDVRDGLDKGLLVKFSGTQVDSHFGENLQGNTLEAVYQGDPDREELVERFRRCAENREIYFRQRATDYDLRMFGRERGAQDLLIVPMTSSSDPESGVGDPPKVSYFCGIASFQILDGVPETVERFIPLDRA